MTGLVFLNAGVLVHKTAILGVLSPPSLVVSSFIDSLEFEKALLALLLEEEAALDIIVLVGLLLISICSKRGTLAGAYLTLLQFDRDEFELFVSRITDPDEDEEPGVASLE